MAKKTPYKARVSRLTKLKETKTEQSNRKHISMLSRLQDTTALRAPVGLLSMALFRRTPPVSGQTTHYVVGKLFVIDN